MMPLRSRSPSKSQSLIAAKSIKFCHYRNGMFMGEMKCFERSGKGIVFLDTGEVALASYEKDKLQGQVASILTQTLLITKNNILYSLVYDHDNLLELVAQTRDKMIHTRFKYRLPDGQSTIIDFQKEEITYLGYKQGRIVKKAVEQDSVFLNRVFSHRNLSTLIPINHLKMLGFQFKFPFVEAMTKNSITTIGFHKQGSLNGLGFMLFKDTQKQNSFYELLEKGYYKESLLSGIGEKRYQNGNLYIGEFKNNVFQGRGLLFNTQKNNWVKGMFKDGNLVQMIEYSNEGNSNSPKIAEMLSLLHRKKSSWVNSELKFHSDVRFNTFLEKEVQNLNEYKGGDAIDYRERKEVVLKRIQNNFVPDHAHRADLMRQSSFVRWDESKLESSNSKRKTVRLASPLKQEQLSLSQRLSKSKSNAKSSKMKKSQLFKVKPSFKSSRKVQIKDDLPDDDDKWKNNTDQIPINIYTFEQSSHSPRFSPSQSKHNTSNVHNFNFSINPQENDPVSEEFKRSISASRRHKIFQNSPSRVVSSSRIGFPSPSKSSIRSSHRINQESSVSDVLQQIKYPSKRSNKMVKSRVFDPDAPSQDSLPSFRYSRFQPQEQFNKKTLKP